LIYKKIIKNQEDSAMKTKNNSLSFKGKDFFIGINVHKKHWTVTIRHNELVL